MSGQTVVAALVGLFVGVGSVWALVPGKSVPPQDTRTSQARGPTAMLSMGGGDLILSCDDRPLERSVSDIGYSPCPLGVRPATLRIIGSPVMPGDLPVML